MNMNQKQELSENNQRKRIPITLQSLTLANVTDLISRFFVIYILFVFVVLVTQILFLEPASSLLTPLTSIVIAIFITKRIANNQEANRKIEFEISQKNREQEILNKYFDDIGKLAFDLDLLYDQPNQYFDPEGKCVSKSNLLQAENKMYTIMQRVKVKTLIVLNRLPKDAHKDKGNILVYLYVFFDMTKRDYPNLQLDSCDFSQANLSSTYLFAIYLPGVNLSGANLEGANLKGSDLMKVNFEVE